MTAPRNVMFVDDEPLVLTGLRNGLRKHRKRWNMTFAVGGPAARAELDKTEFDVVVSDMRMPEVDGATLLAELRARTPRTVRLVLSGYAERGAVIRARAVSHEMFDKPCNLDLLALAIDRGCALRDLFGQPDAQAARARLAPLPDPPKGYPWLAPGLDDPPGVLAMASALASDAALTAAILELARSPVLAPPRPITTLADVARTWSPWALSTFALLAHAFAVLGADPAQVAETRARTLAVTARAIQLLPAARHIEVMCVALLHDLGTLLAHRVPDVAPTTLAAIMLESWRMPLPVLDGIAFYAAEDPLESPIRAAIRAARCSPYTGGQVMTPAAIAEV